MDDEAVLVDTNVLLTATTPARALHTEALEVLNEWPARGFVLCVSGQVFREYLVVATRPTEVNGLGLSVEDSLGNVAELRPRFRLRDERVANLRPIESDPRHVAHFFRQHDVRHHTFPFVRARRARPSPRPRYVSDTSLYIDHVSPTSCPPSTTKIDPVVKLDASDAR